MSMDYDYDFDYVNFTDDTITFNLPTRITHNNDNYDDYDTTTTEQYRALRLYKIDPILNEPIPSNLIFEFKHKWNPISGHRTEVDDYGPLCFNAWNLYQYYYSNKFNGIWNPPAQQFQGYYGDLLGCGERYVY